MSKPVLGLILGAILGAFDGLTAYLEPDIANRPDVGTVLSMIMFYSSIKGLIAGAIIGFFARKVTSLNGGILFGGAIGLLLAFLVAAMPDESGKHYWLQIMIPGTYVGLILGFATQELGKIPKTTVAKLELQKLQGESQKCEEASNALTYAILSLFFWAILAPFAIKKANKAEKIISENPQLQGRGKAKAAKIIAIATMTIWGFTLIALLSQI
jgi:hypothetical protein